MVRQTRQQEFSRENPQGNPTRRFKSKQQNNPDEKDAVIRGDSLGKKTREEKILQQASNRKNPTSSNRNIISSDTQRIIDSLDPGEAVEDGKGGLRIKNEDGSTSRARKGSLDGKELFTQSDEFSVFAERANQREREAILRRQDLLESKISGVTNPTIRAAITTEVNRSLEDQILRDQDLNRIEKEEALDLFKKRGREERARKRDEKKKKAQLEIKARKEGLQLSDLERKEQLREEKERFIRQEREVDPNQTRAFLESKFDRENKFNEAEESNRLLAESFETLEDRADPEELYEEVVELTNEDIGKAEKLLSSRGYSKRFIRQNRIKYQREVLGLSDEEVDEAEKERSTRDMMEMALGGKLSEAEMSVLDRRLNLESTKTAFRYRYLLDNPSASPQQIERAWKRESFVSNRQVKPKIKSKVQSKETSQDTVQAVVGAGVDESKAEEIISGGKLDEFPTAIPTELDFDSLFNEAFSEL